MESRNEEKLSREEMIRRQRERRRKVRQRRMRRARMIRAALCLGLLAVCVFTGVLVAGKMGLIRGAKGDKASAQTPPVQELSETFAEQTMPEPVAPPKSWEGNLPEIGALYGIAVNGAEWSHFYVDNSYAMAPKGKYARSFRATLHNQPEDMTGTIEYRVNLTGIGLIDLTYNGGEGGDCGGESPMYESANQLSAATQAISDITGIRPVLMRPCEGKQSDAGMAVLAANSMPAVLWSLDALDTETKDAAKIVNKVLDTVKDGDIILMRDTQDVTAEAVELLIPELMNRGYQLVTVSELSSYRGGMVPGGVYREFPPNQAEADGPEKGE